MDLHAWSAVFITDGCNGFCYVSYAASAKSFRRAKRGVVLSRVAFTGAEARNYELCMSGKIYARRYHTERSRESENNRLTAPV